MILTSSKENPKTWQIKFLLKASFVKEQSWNSHLVLPEGSILLARTPRDCQNTGENVKTRGKQVTFAMTHKLFFPLNPTCGPITSPSFPEVAHVFFSHTNTLSWGRKQVPLTLHSPTYNTTCLRKGS